jgi:hypothetical protein
MNIVNALLWRGNAYSCNSATLRSSLSAGKWEERLEPSMDVLKSLSEEPKRIQSAIERRKAEFFEEQQESRSPEECYDVRERHGRRDQQLERLNSDLTIVSGCVTDTNRKDSSCHKKSGAGSKINQKEK